MKNWKITEHRRISSAYQEMKVRALVWEIATYESITYAESFETKFKELVKQMRRTNNFSADLMYKIVCTEFRQIELWKLKANGELNYKIFTLVYAGN